MFSLVIWLCTKSSQIRFEDPQKEWKLDKEWLVWPSNIRIKLDFRGETTKAK